MSVEQLVKVARDRSNEALAAGSAAVGAAGAATAIGADRAIAAAKDRYIASKVKGADYNEHFLRNGGTKKGVKNPFSAAKRLMSQNAKAEALRTAYGAGGVARKIAKGGKIAAGLGAAGVLAAGARSLLSKKKED